MENNPTSSDSNPSVSDSNPSTSDSNTSTSEVKKICTIALSAKRNLARHTWHQSHQQMKFAKGATMPSILIYIYIYKYSNIEEQLSLALEKINQLTEHTNHLTEQNKGLRPTTQQLSPAPNCKLNTGEQRWGGCSVPGASIEETNGLDRNPHMDPQPLPLQCQWRKSLQKTPAAGKQPRPIEPDMCGGAHHGMQHLQQM